jgi:hypothetical protein
MAPGMSLRGTNVNLYGPKVTLYGTKVSLYSTKVSLYGTKVSLYGSRVCLLSSRVGLHGSRVSLRYARASLCYSWVSLSYSRVLTWDTCRGDFSGPSRPFSKTIGNLRLQAIQSPLLPASITPRPAAPVLFVLPLELPYGSRHFDGLRYTVPAICHSH